MLYDVHYLHIFFCGEELRTGSLHHAPSLQTKAVADSVAASLVQDVFMFEHCLLETCSQMYGF